MLRFLAGAAALALAALPAGAQTPGPGGQPQMNAPSGPNSGVGVQGMPGNKSGPAPKRPSETSGAGTGADENKAAGHDTSKVPGLPGNKSGPAVRQPSDSAPK